MGAITFDPIAIVGQGFVMPGEIFTEDQFWHFLTKGKSVLSKADHQDFGCFEVDSYLSTEARPDKAFHAVGGHIRGFASQFDGTGLRLSKERVHSLDPFIQWLLYAGNRALPPATRDSLDPNKMGVIIGNLSFPSRSLNQLAIRSWLEQEGSWDSFSSHPYFTASNSVSWENRFMSGGPAQILCDALGMKGKAFALDAACASSLYAIKLACDELSRGDADLMLAGGVNGIDSLFLNVGFTALHALSRQGVCRPFDAKADGLIPAKGAVVFALRRLVDALADGEKILGVIRGIGLSNDGKKGGFLSPDQEGQMAALKKAYLGSGIDPLDIDYLECHATGTLLGDETEIKSLQSIFAQGRQNKIPIGSMKGHMGHMVTAAGGASLLKVLQFFKHGQIHPSCIPEETISILKQSVFYLPKKADAVTETPPCRAGVNAFGFGGNNAHLIVESFHRSYHEALCSPAKTYQSVAPIPIAVVGASRHSGGESFTLDISKLFMPPNDLKAVLPQQSLLLAQVQQAVRQLNKPLPHETHVYVGMSVDPEVCRYRFRLLLKESPYFEPWCDQIIPALDATRLLGCMPNVPANRISQVYDFTGESYTVSAESESGQMALDCAINALRSGQTKCAIVAAIDLTSYVHARACAEIWQQSDTQDGCIVLILKRLDDALTDKDQILSDRVDSLGLSVQTEGYAHGCAKLESIANSVEAPKLVDQETMGLQLPTHLPIFNLTSPMQEAPALVSAAPAYRQESSPPTMIYGELRGYLRGLFKSHEQHLDLLQRTNGDFSAFLSGSWLKQKKDLSFDRNALLVHAGGKLSQVFGPAFTEIDAYPIRVRMPQPPLLLVDRIVDLEGEPLAMGTGKVVTETDITPNRWYLHQNHILAGILIEAGQADLFLISYLGIDRIVKGLRAYRLLGCQVTFHADLPKVGDTVRFDIYVERHAREGEKRIFFFYYDAYVGSKKVLSVRYGHAGFFTSDELRESKGILWEPTKDKFKAKGCGYQSPWKIPASFGPNQLQAFASGDLVACFGESFALAAAHRRSPCVSSGQMLLLDSVTALDRVGGPVGRGYLRAVRKINADDWFFAGHFKNDPCMPGTLMTEMAFQALSFYLSALGLTLDKDYHRFIPAQNETCSLYCRGQVLPTSQLLTLELFIDEIIEGPKPTVFAHVLLTVDGAKALLAERMGVTLAPDWPVVGDKGQIQACCDGPPCEAFGALYEYWQTSGLRVPRLPSYPFTFMSRVTHTHGPYGKIEDGFSIVSEWDVPDHHPLFGGDPLPYYALQEALLQPCGWLGSYMGCPLVSRDELLFRNLDGSLHFLSTPGSFRGKTIQCRVTCVSHARASDSVIVFYKVAAHIQGEHSPFCEVTTTFGYFKKQALAVQKGFPGRKEELHGESWEVNSQQSVAMLDRVSLYSPNGGSYGNGFIRGEKHIDPRAWYFKSHFFQDPVQPGSLGMQSLYDLLEQFVVRFITKKNLTYKSFISQKQPPLTWKYRGQILPIHHKMEMQIHVSHCMKGSICGDGSVWIDGLKIYEAKGLWLEFY